MFTFKRNTVEFKRNGVKYVAKISNLDKKYVFKRDFINGFSFDTHSNTFILEFAFTDGTKKHFIIDSKKETVTEVSYEELKKQAKDGLKFFEDYLQK